MEPSSNGEKMTEKVMTNVYWLLGRERIPEYDKFVDAVTSYNNEIAPERTEWDPDQVISQEPVRIVFEAMWKDEDDTIDLRVGSPGEPVTMGEVLYTLNNETVEFFALGSNFFEGLSRGNGDTLHLWIGS
jgi:hypothetical protein